LLATESEPTARSKNGFVEVRVAKRTIDNYRSKLAGEGVVSGLSYMPCRSPFCAAGVAKFPDRRFSAPSWGLEKVGGTPVLKETGRRPPTAAGGKTNAGTLITP
jgi:hypothetical protein